MLGYPKVVNRWPPGDARMSVWGRLSGVLARLALMPMRGDDVPRHPVRRAEAHPDQQLPPDRYPGSIPAVAQVLAEGLDLGLGVTFLVGESGSGKSTIVEAIAMAFGMSPESGSTHSPSHPPVRRPSPSTR